MWVRGKKGESVITLAPLTMFFHELLKGYTLETVSGLILMDPPSDVTKADDIVLRLPATQ